MLNLPIGSLVAASNAACVAPKSLPSSAFFVHSPSLVRYSWLSAFSMRMFMGGIYQIFLNRRHTKQATTPKKRYTLFMVMCVTSPIGWRVGDGGGRLHKSCFDQVGFHFVPADIGEYVPVDLDTGGKVLSALLNHLRVE